jgi:hypothetical protein
VIVDGANGRRIYTRSDVESANVSKHCVVRAVEQTRGKSNIPIDPGASYAYLFALSHNLRGSVDSPLEAAVV